MQKGTSREIKKYSNKISDFIWVKDSALSSEFCNHCIEKFEEDDSLYPGCTASGVDKNIKDTMDLRITDREDWLKEDEIFRNSLSKGIQEYKDYMCTFSSFFELQSLDYYDTGYQIQRYEPDSGYTWHHDDDLSQKSLQRSMTFIWYLNTIEEDGYTEFVDGTRVRAKEGRMAIFPSSWTFLHRGYPPKNQRKYICTGWLHAY